MPPIPQKQAHTNSNRQQTTTKSNGSILSQAIPIEELASSPIKIVIYGDNRVGKSYLACQFPKPLLLMSLEPNATGGAKSITKFKNVTYLRVESSDKALRLASELRQNNPFKTVVIDSATSLQDIILKEILNLPEVPDMNSWGMATMDNYRARSEKTRETLRPFLNLDCHTVITAKQRDHNALADMKPRITKGAQIESFFAADLGGATVGWLHDACDYICQLVIQKEVVTRKRINPISKKEIEEEVETGKIIRRLRTMYHPNYAAGFRAPDPTKVPEYIDDPTYDKIQAVIDGEYEV